jgi:hypothetical protein
VRSDSVVVVSSGRAPALTDQGDGTTRAVGVSQGAGLLTCAERGEDAVGERLPLEQAETRQHGERRVEAEAQLVVLDPQHKLVEAHVSSSSGSIGSGWEHL